jgi:hypothetical protein
MGGQQHQNIHFFILFSYSVALYVVAATPKFNNMPAATPSIALCVLPTNSYTASCDGAMRKTGLSIGKTALASCIFTKLA